jgi:hypothetical protein
LEEWYDSSHAGKKKGWPDLSTLLKVTNLLRAVAVMFGHVEHDALALLGELHKD